MKGIGVLLIMAMFFAGSGHGASDVSLANQPIDISSMKLIVDERARSAVFRGDVIARQGDVTVYSDSLVLLMGEDETLEKLNAVDNVRIVRGDEVATADKADYDLKRQEIVLQGHAKIHRGDNSLSGDQIVINLETRRSVVTGDSKGRVKAQFIPQRGGE